MIWMKNQTVMRVDLSLSYIKRQVSDKLRIYLSSIVLAIFSMFKLLAEASMISL